jgi:hypothetical protein
MRAVSPAWILVLSLRVSLASLPLYAQAGSDFELATPVKTPSLAPGNIALRRFVAVNDLVSGFNGMGRRAADLRHAMKREEAEAFDAVMLDVMGALIALPSFGLVDSGDATRIRPRKPRYDRIPQIGPDLLALDKFFARLQHASSSASDARMFASARKDVRRMLSALPILLPTVSSKDSSLMLPKGQGARR